MSSCKQPYTVMPLVLVDYLPNLQCTVQVNLLMFKTLSSNSELYMFDIFSRNTLQARCFDTNFNTEPYKYVD